MHHRKAADDMSRLVALERADQVPVHPKLPHFILLAQRFLNPVLAHGLEPGGNRCADGLRAVALGNRHDGHRLPRAASGLAFGNPGPDLREALRQCFERHSLQK